MLIADISGRTLARLARRPAPGRGLPLRPAREHVEIDGTPAGTALTTQRIHVSRDEDGMWVHIPVSERGEAVGVLPPSSSSTGTAPPASYPHSCRQRTGHLITAQKTAPHTANPSNESPPGGSGSTPLRHLPQEGSPAQCGALAGPLPVESSPTPTSPP